MYIVKLDNNKIFDQRIDELTLIEPIIQLEENSAGSFTFTITNNHPYYDAIKRRSSIIQVFEDSELLFSGMVYEITEDFYKNRKVYCEGELSYLNDSIQRPAEYHNMSVRGLLEKYINNHNAQVEAEKQFRIGIVTVTDSNNSIYCYTNMESTLKCIKEDLVDDFGGIIRIRHSNGVKYIDYIKESDVNVNTQVIMLGENLINYKSNISSLDIATAIIPLGAKLETSPIAALDMRLDIKSANNNLDYVSDSVAVNTFGWIYKTVIWDDVNNASTLKQKGIKYLTDTQFDNLVIEVNAVDMHLIDKTEKPYRLSDNIRIVSKPHGLKNKYFRLTKQTINLNNPESNSITLGKEEHISLSARTVQANNDVLKAMESITPESTILKHAKENASALINGNGENGYVVLHENSSGVVYEILIMDQPKLENATKIWRWNQNGFGFANSKDQYGNWKFGTAITMDGRIVADYISTGTMSADRIQGGTLSVGGQDNKSGLIQVKNASGTALVTINNQGIDIDAGTINIGTTFEVDASGTMKASNAEVKGEINATSGNISGQLSVGGKTGSESNGGSIVVKDTNNNQVVKLSESGIDIDKGSIDIGSKFKVATDGKLTATGTDITGQVKATSGYIGNATNGWQIANSSIYNGCTSKDDTTPGMYIGTDGFRNQYGQSFTRIVNGTLVSNTGITGKNITANESVVGATINGQYYQVSADEGTYNGIDHTIVVKDSSDNLVGLIFKKGILVATS